MYLRNTNCPFYVPIHFPILRFEYANAAVIGVVCLRENKRQAVVERLLSTHVYFLENTSNT